MKLRGGTWFEPLLSMAVLRDSLLLLLPPCFYIAKCNKRECCCIWLSGPGFQHLDRRTHATSQKSEKTNPKKIRPDRRTNRRTNGRTDGRTDERTDTERGCRIGLADYRCRMSCQTDRRTSKFASGTQHQFDQIPREFKSYSCDFHQRIFWSQRMPIKMLMPTPFSVLLRARIQREKNLNTER
jgi:hypothetical protein